MATGAEREGLSETGRIEAFSDGVFAIAVTLLILGVQVPREGDIGAALLRQWPSYVGYLTSFLTIGVMWINHHHLLTLIDRSDRTFLVANTLLLMCIGFVPFPTAVLAEHVQSSGARPAAVLYGAVLTLTAICFNLVWRYAASGRRLIGPSVSDRAVRDISRSYSFGPFVYAGAGLVAFASSWASAALYLAIAAFYAVPPALFRRTASD